MLREKQTELSVEDDFRRGLEDCHAVISRLAPLASDVGHLVALVKLALDNEDAFALTYNLLASQSKKS